MRLVLLLRIEGEHGGYELCWQLCGFHILVLSVLGQHLLVGVRGVDNYRGLPLFVFKFEGPFGLQHIYIIGLKLLYHQLALGFFFNAPNKLLKLRFVGLEGAGDNTS